MALKYVQGLTMYQAGSGSIIGATSIVLTSLTDIYGNVLTMTDFGALGYGTCESDTTNEEAFTFTGITPNSNGTYTLTGVSTALAKSPYTETSGLIRQHAGGTKIVFTDNAAFWNTFANKKNDETIDGQWTFTSFPITPSNSDASTTVKGVAKLSVAPALSTNPIAVGTNDTRMPSADPTTLFAPLSMYAPGIITPYAGSSAPTGWLLCDGSAVSRSTYASLFAITSTTYGVGNGSTTFNVPDLRSRLPLGVGAGTKVFTFSSRSSDTITVTGSNNTITSDLQTGQSVLYHYTGTAITGLVDNTTYYIIRIAYNQFKLASSLANAVAGTQISLSSDGSGTQTFTHSLTTRTLAETGGEETHALTTNELAAHVHGQGVGGASNQITVNASGNTANSNTASAGGSAEHNIMNPFLALNYIIKT